VNKYFEYVNTHRWDDYLTLFDEHVVVDEQLMGHLEGLEAVADGIEGLRVQHQFTNKPLHVVVEGDEAMVVWHISAPAAVPGGSLEVTGANYYVVRNGKIVKFSNYHDTAPFAPVLAAQAAAAAPAKGH
jgi:ketosteroid isomerase-like protein